MTHRPPPEYQQTTGSSEPSVTLLAVLDRLLGQRQSALRLGRLLQAASGLLAAFLLWCFLDAWRPSPAGLRVVLALLAVSAAALALFWIRGRRHDRHTLRQQQARRLEVRLRLAHNELICAVQLAQQPAPPAAAVLSTVAGVESNPLPYFTQQAQARALTLLEQYRQQLAHPPERRALRRPATLLAALAALLLLVAVLQPRLLSCGLARLFNPLGDHPPFSPTRLSLQALEPQAEPGQAIGITAGSNLRLEALVTGPVPERLELVELDDKDRALYRWPMHAQPYGRFRRELINLRQPLRLIAQAGTARSHRLMVTILPPAAPPPPETAQPDPSETAVDSGESAASSTTDNAESRAALQAQALAETARQLATDAAQLREQLARRDALPPAQRQLRLAQLQSRLRELLERAAQLRQQLQAAGLDVGSAGEHVAADGTEPGIAGQTLSTAQLLAELTRMLDGERWQRLAAGALSSAGAADPDNAAARDWLWQLQAATQAAARQLARAPAAGQAASTTAGPGSVAQNSGTGLHAAALAPATGVRREEMPHTGAVAPPAGLSPALWQQVPPSYRELTAQYFDALAGAAVPATASPGDRPADPATPNPAPPSP